jgi:exodeoxyribonuclease V alpha subunit
MSLKNPSRVLSVPTAQMDWLNDLPAQGLSAAQTLQWLQLWTGQGLLRHIDTALAAQLLRLDAQAQQASPALLVAAALLAQMEGRGHTCLPLADLCAPPAALLGWPTVAVDGPQGLHALWSHLPGTLHDWQAALQGPTSSKACVRHTDAPDQGQPLVLGGTADVPLLYLRRYAGYEKRVGQGLWQRAREPLAVPEAAARQWLDRFFVPNADSPADIDWQKTACAVALRARLSVITGGPGTGKTYTAARLLALLLALHEGDSPLRVALAAPTGKAAARLKQSIDNALTSLQEQVPEGSGLDLNTLITRMGPARTLHSLLGARPDTRQFRHHAANPLDVDVLIVDEASMVHLEMMDALLQALPPTARLVLLGDKDQLASVEAGAVLGDLCRDAALGHYSEGTAQFVHAVTGQTLAAEYLAHDAPVLAQQTVMLRESRRFKGAIGQLALAVNRGDAVAARDCLGGTSHEDFAGADAGRDGLAGDLSRSQTAATGQLSPLLALQPATPQAVCVLALGAQGKPSYADYLGRMQQGPAGQDPESHATWVRSVLQAFESFRILCAVHQGDWGTTALNAAVQKALADAGWLQPQGEWFAGRPVMVTRNDAQLGVFNGDVGVVLPSPQGVLKVWFADGEQLRSVSVSRLAHADTAFVMTVHKSQGSEFAHTVLVLPPGAADVLSRELVYTGITRAREQFTLIEAQPGLLHGAMARPSVRVSGLRLWWV